VICHKNELLVSTRTGFVNIGMSDTNKQKPDLTQQPVQVKHDISSSDTAQWQANQQTRKQHYCYHNSKKAVCIQAINNLKKTE
jgi:hypothetical protein